MWRTFEKLVLKGYTLRRIREEMASMGYNLDNFKDPILLQKMCTILRASDA